MICGATLVASATATMYRGFEVYTKMIKGLEDFLERGGIRQRIS